MSEATIFNIQRYSIDDGPGIRTTVFFKGCPLRCPWCSNPESQKSAPELFYRYTSCVKCGACAKACPNGAISLADGIAIDREKCVACGECVRACENDALKLSGEKMTLEKVWKTIRKDLVYYETSGGGVTCSGGEILAQAEFVAELFKLCREMGVHTCADTSGVGSEDALRTVLEFADLVYFDLKQADAAKHAELIGAPLEIVTRSLKIAAASGREIVVRIPLIPEYNADEETLRGFARIIRECAPNARVSLLPYHEYGANKYAAIGRTYALAGLRELTDGEKAAAVAIFENEGFTCEMSR